MTFYCPNCKAQLTGDVEAVGQVVECPECGRDFIAAKPRKLKVAKLATVDAVICYLLGIVFGIIGIGASWAAYGERGARVAIRGFIFHVIIGVAVGVLAFLAMLRM